MKQKNGNDIYKIYETYNQTLNTVGLAKDIFDYNNNLFNSPLKDCINLVNNAGKIDDVLNIELVLLQNLDMNNHNNSEQKIDNRVNLCHTALEEYTLFNTDKGKYLETIYKRNTFNPKGIDINKDTLFEQSVKKLIISLGTEKNASTVSAQFFELYEARQDKLRQVCREFTQERKSFLSQHIKKEPKITEKSKHNQLER